MSVSVFGRTVAWIAPLVLPAITACATTQGGVRSAGGNDGLWVTYWRAVQDAAVIEPHEVSDHLDAVVPGTPGQVWREWPLGSGRQQVKVATWAPGGFEVKVGELQNDRFTWVTLCPKVRDFCRDSGLTGNALDMRLRQRLGLPPNDAKTRFIEYWVYPEDLFRPAAVTSIDTTTVGPTAPRGYVNPHADMLLSQAEGSYTLPTPVGYPWTRLGYTYDWGYGGTGPEEEMGDSEFVIRSGCTIWVDSVTPTGEYGASGR